MQTRAILLEWGLPIQGRELKALEEFMGSVAWWGELKKKGKIEDFHTFGLLTGNMSVRSGFALIVGDDTQIDELVYTDEYRNRIARITGLVNNLDVHTLETGDRMVQRMQRYGTEVKKVIG